MMEPSRSWWSIGESPNRTSKSPPSPDHARTLISNASTYHGFDGLASSPMSTSDVESLVATMAVK